MLRAWLVGIVREAWAAPEDSKPTFVTEADTFIEQARWLLEYHDRRSESLQTRAIAMLALVGALLALLLRSKPPDGVEPGCVLIVAYSLTVLSLIACALACVNVIAGRKLAAPGATQLRENWHLLVTNRRLGKAAIDVAESFLSAKDLTKKSPLEFAIDAANSRADGLKLAARILQASMLALTVTLIALAGQVWR